MHSFWFNDAHAPRRQSRVNAESIVNIYACNKATKTSINDIAKASPKDKGLPIQLLNMNISPIKLIKTI